MDQVCVSSSVTNSHFNLSYPLSEEYRILDLKPFVLSKAIWSIRKRYLDGISAKLKNLIKQKLNGYSVPIEHHISMEFDGRDYMFNVKSDFDICMMIDFYDMVCKTIKFNGDLFFFKKSIIADCYGDSLIAFIRVKNHVNEQTILSGLNNLWLELNLEKRINGEELTAGLNHLMSYGLIHFDKLKKEYSVTPIGYMYW